MSHGKEVHDIIGREIEKHDSDQKVLDGIIASEMYPLGTWIGVLYGETVIVESTEDNFHERIEKIDPQERRRLVVGHIGAPRVLTTSEV